MKNKKLSVVTSSRLLQSLYYTGNKLSLATIIILYWKCEQTMIFSEKVQKKPKKLLRPWPGWLR